MTGLVFAMVKSWEPATEAYYIVRGALQWAIAAGCALLGGAGVPAWRPSGWSPT
ncbi:MAG: hypothetical protein HY901_29395 [Deltaproteobacteria bacterium]|nr:hypothetical protein [Deltaproteobacteria bacterium]